MATEQTSQEGNSLHISSKSSYIALSGTNSVANMRSNRRSSSPIDFPSFSLNVFHLQVFYDAAFPAPRAQEIYRVIVHFYAHVAPLAPPHHSVSPNLEYSWQWQELPSNKEKGSSQGHLTGLIFINPFPSNTGVTLHKQPPFSLTFLKISESTTSFIPTSLPSPCCRLSTAPAPR